MKANGKTVLVCDCEGSMKLDAESLAGAFDGDVPFVNTQMCRSQLDNFRDAITDGEPVIVCCTREAPLFDEIAAEEFPDTAISYVNIRETAGWSEQGDGAAAKMAALIAEAALDLEPAQAVSMTSEGRVIVYGGGESTLEAAGRLAGRMDVTCVARPGTEIGTPALNDLAVFQGTTLGAKGYLGAFSMVFKDFVAASPSSRASLDFSQADGGEETLEADIIVDLSGQPSLFAGGVRREGYFRADPANPASVERALFDAADMVGTFEKPTYVRLNETICAHSRNGKTGCTRCLAACPTSAIQPDGDSVIIDPYICIGHGACSAVCPSGAISYDQPAANGLATRLRVVLKTYRDTGGQTPMLLVHDRGHGADVIAMLAQHGRGLPSHVIAFVVNEVTQVGIDFLLSAMAYGTSRIHIVAAPKQRDEMSSIEESVGLANTIAAGLGYDGGSISAAICEDPGALEHALYNLSRPIAATPASHQVLGGKRDALGQALSHLHAVAPAPVEFLALPEGAPFGGISVDSEGCTLCLSCVGVCPAGALGDNPDKPQLRLSQRNCIQCGLCKTTCPESVITLVPGIDFTGGAADWQILYEEEPFHCIKCDKPFGGKSTIEHMIGKLQGHAMFSEPGRLDLLKMCDDCRVSAQFEETDNPFATHDRPKVRTTEDYLNERDEDEKLH
ncbi:MAG: 4Fe-4S dicluster domain-containing protein [Alphaproteobacteria bacterium]